MSRPRRTLGMGCWQWLMLFGIALWSASASAGSCNGRFPNPITDVCWKCIFPLKLGGIPLATLGMEDGTNDDPPLICACPEPPPVFYRIGLGISFWEPARVAEAVRTPFCSPTLGGEQLLDASPLMRQGDDFRVSGDEEKAFYHVHWYNFPLFTWLTFLTNTVCDSGESFDLVMLSEYEPTWNRDDLSMILSPEAVLFANPLAQAACSADCVAASSSIGPLNALFWCAGCQNSVYPMTGNVAGHESALTSSLLTVQRMHTKMHRSFISLDMASTDSMCGARARPIIKKGAFKTQMLLPRAYTSNAQFYGETTALWGAGRQYPVQGEDFSYLIFRRRTCCAF
jgi:conjugal transfer pilus assembly protein TraU